MSSDLLIRRAGLWRRRADDTVYYPPEPFSYGVTKPTADNSGCPLDTPLRRHSGDYTASVAGATISNLLIEGRLIITAKDVTVEYCEVLGPATVPATGQIDLIKAEAGGAIIQRVTVNPRAVNEATNGIRFTSAHLRRNKVINVVDHFSLVGADNNSVWEGNFLALPAYFTPCSYQPGDNQTHNDCCQFHNSTGHFGGRNGVSRGNTYSAKYGTKGTHQPSHRGINATGTAMPSGANNPASAAFMFSPTASARTFNFTSEADWFDGGFIPVNTGGSSSSDIGRFRRAKFDGDSGWASTDSTKHPLTFVKSGAVYDAGSGADAPTFYAGPFAGQTVTVR